MYLVQLLGCSPNSSVMSVTFFGIVETTIITSPVLPVLVRVCLLPVPVTCQPEYALKMATYDMSTAVPTRATHQFFKVSLRGRKITWEPRRQQRIQSTYLQQYVHT